MTAIIAALFTLIGASELSAQTGKLEATVIDGKTGEKLVRASVQIIETKQGAYTKDNGVATIPGVAPGESYTVQAKYAGYEPSTLRGVTIRSDITTSLKFSLTNQKQDTIVVTADRKLVEKSKTEISSKLSQSEVQNTPGRTRLDEIIKLTPGLYQDNSNGGLSIHGSRGSSNSIRMANTETTDPVTGQTSSLQNQVSKFAVSEISVTTAGADASKGGFTGGEVNTATRAGSDRFELQVNYRQEVPALFGTSGNGYKQMPENSRIYEVAVGGPITSDLTYFVTARGFSKDFYNYFTSPVFSNSGLGVTDPAGTNAGQLPHTGYYGRSLTTKLTLNVLGFNLLADVLLASESRQYNNIATLYMEQSQMPASNDINNLYSLTGKTQIGDGLLELGTSYLTNNTRVGKYDQSAGGGLFALYKLYDPVDEWTYDDNSRSLVKGADGIIDIYTPVSRQIPDPSNPAQTLKLSATGINPFTGHVEGPGVVRSSDNAYGLPFLFPVAGNVSGFSEDQWSQIQLTGKYTQQVGSHLLNGGFESRLYSVEKQQNGLPWDPNPFKDSFQVKPMSLALYIVDKMEFSDITFNPSLRFDMFNSGSDRYITNPFNPVIRDDTGGISYAVSDAPTQTQLSPRLGITYAVTEQTTFNFNYGWYFKQPLLDFALSNTGGNLSQALQRGNQILGNGGLKAERTKEITVGFQTQLSDVFMVSVQGIYKDLKNLAGLQRISSPYLPVGYSLYSDDQYGNYRGVELTAFKRMADNYSVRLNYTYSVAKGTSSSAVENYTRLISGTGDADVASLPLQPFALGYDKPHVGQLILNLAYGKGEGPTVFGTKLLQYVSVTSTTEYQSGIPYTPLDARGTQIGEFNAARHPDFFQTDATLTRTVPFADIFGESMKDMFLDIQLEVVNLFNRTEPYRVFPTSGQGDDDGSDGKWTNNQEYFNDPTNSLASTRGNQIDEFGKLYYNPRADLNKDGRVSLDEQQTIYTQLRQDRFAIRSNYQAPRRVFLNLLFRF